MRNLCDLTLNKLGELSREVRVEMYSLFDVLTRVRILVVFLRMSEALTGVPDQISLKRALDTIDARIELCSHTESRPLRYWRGVIGKVHIDFQAKLLECRPSPLMLLAVSVDGRTEDSEYPNLLLQTGREPYGL